MSVNTPQLIWSTDLSEQGVEVFLCVRAVQQWRMAECCTGFSFSHLLQHPVTSGRALVAHICRLHEEHFLPACKWDSPELHSSVATLQHLRLDSHRLKNNRRKLKLSQRQVSYHHREITVTSLMSALTCIKRCLSFFVCSIYIGSMLEKKFHTGKISSMSSEQQSCLLLQSTLVHWARISWGQRSNKGHEESGFKQRSSR